MTEIDTQLLTDIKNEISSTKQYFIDRDTAAALVAAQEKQEADAAALVKQEADAAAALVLAQEKQAEIDFRLDLLEKTTNSNDMLNLLTQVDYLSNSTFNADADSPYLEQIATNTQVSDFQNEVGSLSYYSDIGIIIAVFGVLPIYLAYRFIHPIFGMLNKIF